MVTLLQVYIKIFKTDKTITLKSSKLLKQSHIKQYNIKSSTRLKLHEMKYTADTIVDMEIQMMLNGIQD